MNHDLSDYRAWWDIAAVLIECDLKTEGLMYVKCCYGRLPLLYAPEQRLQKALERAGFVLTAVQQCVPVHCTCA